MSFSPAPANPQLDMSGAMPSLFSSYVLYDSGVGRPRDLVRNWLPKRTLGQGASNGGPDAVWQPSSYAPDGGSPSMRFLGNARTPIYPYGGVGQNTIAVGNLDLTSPFVRTYAVEFRLNAIPGRDQSGSVYPLVGQVASGYGGDNDNFAPNVSGDAEGPAIFFNANASCAQFCWGGNVNRQTPALPVWMTDEAGTGTLCEVTPGHWYVGFVTLDPNPTVTNNFIRVDLYDRTTGEWISPAGDQYFFQNGPQGIPNQTTGGWEYIQYGEPTGLFDHIAGPWLPGIDCNIKMSAIINAVNDTRDEGSSFDAYPAYTQPAGVTGLGFASIAAYLVDNPYAPLTATVNTAGSPSTTLYQPLGSGDLLIGDYPYAYGGMTLPVNGSTLSGVPAIPLIAIGDFDIVECDNTTMTFDGSPPVGAPHAIATWKLYGSSAVPVSTGGSPVATGSSMPLVYTPGDTLPHWFALTATDSVGTVYTYGQVLGCCRSKPPVYAIITGNSVVASSGGIGVQVQAAIAAASYNGFDLMLDSQGVGSTGPGNFQLVDPVTLFFSTDNASADLSMLDLCIYRAYQICVATGNKVDFVVLQMFGNGGTSAAGAYAVCEAMLTGVGTSGTWQVDGEGCIKAVHLNACPAQITGHSIDAVSAFYTDYLPAMVGAAAMDPTRIFVTGIGAQNASLVTPWAQQNGHPLPIALTEGVGYVQDYLALSDGGGGGVYPAQSDVRLSTVYGPTSNETGTLHVPTAAQVLSGIAVDATTGTVVLPATTDVRLAATFGPSGGSTGSLHVPTASQVLSGIAVDATTGTVTLPTAGQVIAGIGFGAGSATDGTVTLPTAGQVLTSITFGPGSGLTGTIVLPTTGQVETGVTFGPGSDLTGTFAGGGSGALSSDGVDSIEITTGINLRQAISLILAEACGEITGTASGSPVVKDPVTQATRISATLSNGDRTSTTITPPA